MKIRTAHEIQSIARAGGYRAWVAKHLREDWSYTTPIQWGDVQGEVYAYVVRSIWVADCPICAGCSPVDLGDVFYCVDCGMTGNGYKPAAIVWPTDRATIERLLLLRPVPDNRNWLITEGVDDLRRENAEHGIGEGN